MFPDGQKRICGYDAIYWGRSDWLHFQFTYKLILSLVKASSLSRPSEEEGLIGTTKKYFKLLLNQNDQVEVHLHLIQKDSLSGAPKMV